jgi:hypothetical protein
MHVRYQYSAPIQQLTYSGRKMNKGKKWKQEERKNERIGNSKEGNINTLETGRKEKGKSWKQEGRKMRKLKTGRKEKGKNWKQEGRKMERIENKKEGKGES